MATTLNNPKDISNHSIHTANVNVNVNVSNDVVNDIVDDPAATATTTTTTGDTPDANTPDANTFQSSVAFKLRSSTRQRKNRNAATMSNNSTSDSEKSSTTSNSNSNTTNTSLTSNPIKNGRKKLSKGSKNPKKETPPEKRRVRTGCLTCRSKHKKCDETKPICNFCQLKNLKCIWPQNGMTKPSQFNDTLKNLLSNTQNNHIGITKPLDDLDLDFNLNFNYEPKYLNLPLNFPSILSIIPNLKNGNFQSSNINSFIFFNDKSISTSSSIFSQSLTNLLSNYFLTDPTYMLHLNNPNHILSLSRESKSLTYAILAISSRLLQQFDLSYSGENTLDFYILSVRELSKSLRNEMQGILNESFLINNECIWWTVVLLSWFEIFSVNPSELWGRCKNLINFFNVLGILENPRFFHIFVNLLIIPYCCKLKHDIDNENDNDNTNTNANNDNTTNDNDNDNEQDLILFNSLSHYFLNSKNDILCLTFQSFLFNKISFITWVDLWNLLLDWRLKLNKNQEFVQLDGAIILAIDKDLFNLLLYHSACYYLLINKPEHVNLIFQNPNDYSTIIAFEMIQKNNFINLNGLINYHRSRLIKILQSNMITKNRKSIYSSTACWIAGFVLNLNIDNILIDETVDEHFDKSEVKLLLQKISLWCNLEIFKWLNSTYL